MRYYLKIRDYEFPNVSEMEITGTFRKESIQQNLAGSYLIDRTGAEKVKIEAKLNLLTRAEMYNLRYARNQMSNAVTYDRNGVRTTSQMIIREFAEPTPVKYTPSDTSSGVDTEYIYLTLNITLEEI